MHQQWVMLQKGKLAIMKVYNKKTGIVVLYKSFEAQGSISSASQCSNALIRALLDEITVIFKVLSLHQHHSIRHTAVTAATPASATSVAWSFWPHYLPALV